MSRLRLSFACGNYDRMAALRTGDVVPEGIDLNYIAVDAPREIFDRMGSRQEFDVAEFSSSEFISAFARGNYPLVALPVFPSRVFRHGHIYVTGTRASKPRKISSTSASALRSTRRRRRSGFAATHAPIGGRPLDHSLGRRSG